MICKTTRVVPHCTKHDLRISFPTQALIYTVLRLRISFPTQALVYTVLRLRISFPTQALIYTVVRLRNSVGQYYRGNYMYYQFV